MPDQQLRCDHPLCIEPTGAARHFTQLRHQVDWTNAQMTLSRNGVCQLREWYRGSQDEYW